MIGRNLVDLAAPEAGVHMLKLVENVRAAGAMEGREFNMRRLNGARFWAEVSIAVVREAEGTPEGVLLIIGDITARKAAEFKAQQETTINMRDSLTDCYSRMAFHDDLERMGRDMARSMPMSLMVAEVHGIDIVNDIFGRDGGDDALIMAAEIFGRPFRRIDKVARVAGSRFAVILPRVINTLARRKQDRVVQDLAKFNADRRGVPLQMALGTATAQDAAEGTIYELLRRAEQDLEEAKTALNASPGQLVLMQLMTHLEERQFLCS